jgi:hypothetical protein
MKALVTNRTFSMRVGNKQELDLDGIIYPDSKPWRIISTEKQEVARFIKEYYCTSLHVAWSDTYSNTSRQDKYKKLMEQLNNEQKKVKELNDKIKLYENNDNVKKIKKLEEIIVSLTSQINDLKNNTNKDKITNIKSGEEIVALFFTSINGEIHRPISCKNTDTFVKIEEKIYNEYPKYKDYNTYLTVNGNVIKRFKTNCNYIFL